MKPSNVAIFVGDAIEHESERRVLELLIDELSALGQWATVFANVHIDSHQIDFIVGSSAQTLLIEAKAYSRPIRGGENGAWERSVGAGVWKPIRNAYQQALKAKYALRDRMSKFDLELHGYPDACVLGVPRIPVGSSILSSDKKVRITSLNELSLGLSGRSSQHWSQQRWREFAVSLRLRSVDSADAACSAQLFEAWAPVDEYRTAFQRSYRPDLKTFQSDVYTVDETQLDAASVAEIVISSDDDLIIRGPSGCGKSLVGKHIAVEAAARGFVPIIVQAKHFQGRLGPLLEQELGLLGTSLATIGRAVRRTGSQLLLIVDGYNECEASQRVSLVRSLAAMSLRGAKLVISSQIEIERSDLVVLRRATLRAPTEALKAAIVRAVAPQSRMDATEILLSCVSSGFEADILGRLGGELVQGLSRSALIDAYARRRLGSMATEGLRLLVEIAGWLSDRATYSMSVRDVDRLLQGLALSPEALLALEATGLVSNRAGRFSFGHELLLNAFTAESVIRRAHGSAAAIQAALSAPRFDSCRGHILGGIDDETLAAEVLGGTQDRDLLLASAAGQCGLFAQRWVEQRCSSVLERARDEVRGIQFLVNVGAWMGVSAVPDSVVEWSQSDRSIQHVIAVGLTGGRHIAEVLDIIESLDAVLASSWSDLREEAREKKVHLRSGLFASAYFLSSRGAAISAIVEGIHSGALLLRVAPEMRIVETLQSCWNGAMTPGQVYLLLSLSRHAADRGFVVPQVLHLFGERWRFSPYHLQLELLNFVYGLGNSEGQPWRADLIGKLQALLDNENPLMNSSVFDALQSLGALVDESDEYTDSVRKQLHGLLQKEASENLNGEAWGLYGCQFDHPLSSAYCEAIGELSDGDTGRFLRMACEGADGHAMFLSSVIERLSAMRYAPAASAIARRAGLPDRNSFMPQDAVCVFVAAHIALGQLGAQLPQARGTVESSTDSAVLACGDLFYWSSRSDLGQDAVKAASEDAFAVLSRDNPYIGLSAIRMVCETGLLDRASHSLTLRYPSEVLDLARKTLVSTVEPFGYDRHSLGRDTLEYAFQVIAHLGDRVDLPAVRRFVEDPRRGKSALRAIRDIEERTSSTHKSSV